MYKFLFFFLFVPVTVSAQRLILNGRVTDAANKPVEFATATIVENNSATYTDEKGDFHFTINARQYPAVTIKITVVNKQTVTRNIVAAQYNAVQQFTLQDLSLNLKEVVVTARQIKSEISNSSIVFDREALDQLQAFSLADVLNNLPGKVTTPPDLQHLQVATLRTAASTDPTQQNINSMGVAIYVDGVRISNDANMQNKGIGLWGTSRGVIDNHKDPVIGSAAYDTPFGGLDLRNFPIDNVENIEIVQGITSAKYGEVTSGAIFIRTKTGVTPYSANVRLNGSSVNTSLSKGFSLGRKGGDINANINYLNSIQDPTNSLKAYGRFNGGLKWTKRINKWLNNSFATSFAYKNDNAKADPDDGYEETTYAKERRISLTNQLSLRTDSKLFNSGTLNLSYDVGYQESYRQRYVNGATLAVADKDTTGIYEGYYAPGNYYATEHIVGKPYNFSSSLDLASLFITGKVYHSLSYGVNMYLSGNTGKGVLADASRSPTNSGSASTLKSDRPYDFDLQRPIINFGFFAEDRIRFNVFKRELSTGAGIRYDLQNGYPSIQPRINSSYQISKKWSVRAAYGISTKAPSMSYRYPAPTYFDIPLLNVGNGNANQSLYLVYTRKVLHDNSSLRPSRSSQAELGFSANYGVFNTSMYGYYKKDRDGFSSNPTFLPITLPEYTYTVVTGQKPVAVLTGKQKLYAGLSDIVIENGVSSDNYGIDWFLSTKKFENIQTSFSLGTSITVSKFNNLGTMVMATSQTNIDLGKTARYGIYPGTNTKNTSITSKLNIDTHIPSLGFVVSLITDINWRNVQQYLGKSIYPIAYIDKNGNTFPIETFDANNPDYGYLTLTPDKASTLVDPPFVYANISLRIAKEVKKKMRISLFAYNFLDTKIQYYNDVTLGQTTYNTPVSVGAEVAFKF